MEYVLGNVRTSWAYVLYNGFFVFQVGPTKNGDKLGVVRLGRHRENEEIPPGYSDKKGVGRVYH